MKTLLINFGIGLSIAMAVLLAIFLVLNPPSTVEDDSVDHLSNEVIAEPATVDEETKYARPTSYRSVTMQVTLPDGSKDTYTDDLHSEYEAEIFGNTLGIVRYQRYLYGSYIPMVGSRIGDRVVAYGQWSRIDYEEEKTILIEEDHPEEK